MRSTQPESKGANAMYNSITLDMPTDFPKRVHRALRTWHDPRQKGALSDLVLAREVSSAQRNITVRGVSNEILMGGLNHLRSLDVEAHDILQRRFPNNETAHAVAFRLNVSEDVIFQRQRVALVDLAAVIWDQELEARRMQVRRLEPRLEPPTYTRLFGVTESLTEARTVLGRSSEPWIVSLEGMGGIGKTALADAIAREAAAGTRFHEIAWVSMRHAFFALSSAIATRNEAADVTLTGLLNSLIRQFGLSDLQRQSTAQQAAGVRQYLKSMPCLVVIDNLETMTAYPSLISYLHAAMAPSKFVLTSRTSLQGEPGIYILKLVGLSFEDTLSLVRHEAATQGLSQLARASDAELGSIYEVTGGNPLATKLVIGQTHTFPLNQVLDRLRNSDARADEEILTFIHADAWQALDAHSRQLLIAMVITGDGGGRIEQIAAAAGLDLGLAATALHRLVSLSLVSVKGGLNERRYALHSLTRAFVARHAQEGGL
jgi:hypothetical protein